MTDDLSAKLRRMDALRAENAADPHPSFVRIEAASRSWEAEATLLASDPLGVEGAASVSRRIPSFWSMLIPFFVLFAFAVGLFLAYVSHYGVGCPTENWNGSVTALLTAWKC